MQHPFAMDIARCKVPFRMDILPIEEIFIFSKAKNVCIAAFCKHFLTQIKMKRALLGT